MPYLHCKKCHHEWEGQAKSKCDWCGEDSMILEQETPLEKMMGGDWMSMVDKLVDGIKRKKEK